MRKIMITECIVAAKVAVPYPGLLARYAVRPASQQNPCSLLAQGVSYAIANICFYYAWFIACFSKSFFKAFPIYDRGSTAQPQGPRCLQELPRQARSL